MNDALYIAATGMYAHQKSVDAIANNLANVNTPGFKKTRVSFENLVYRGLLGVGVGERNWQGSGVGIAGMLPAFVAGELRRTEQALDLALDGEGFIEVTDGTGNSAYTRGGSLRVNAEGLLATAEGYVLKPGLHVGDAREPAIDADGMVSVKAGDGKGMVNIGRIELVRFGDVSGLVPVSGNLYRASERSGDAIAGRPGEDRMGRLVQGALEASNVRLVDEMVDLMAAQRAYESSVKVIQAADDMLSMSNNLRK